MDWKEALLAKSRELGIEPAAAEAPDASATAGELQSENLDTLSHKDACNCGSAIDENVIKSSKLHLLMERKGRAGKTATIIEGFDCSEQLLKQIATRLKQSMGVGGSVRGSEILLQGDRRAQAAEQLRQMGFKKVSVG